MVIFKTKSDQNNHQNAPNYTIFKNFLGKHVPNPIAKRMERHAKIYIKKKWRLLLNPGYAPVVCSKLLLTCLDPFL